MRALTVVVLAVLSVAAQAQDDRASDTDKKVRDQLSSMRINLDFTQARLGDVVAYFQEHTGLNFHLDAESLAKQDESRITIRLKDVAIKTALKLILRPRDLGCVLRNGALVIAPKSQLQTETVTRVYEARDVMFGIMDFAGPRMELKVSGSGGIICLFPFEEAPRATLPSELLLDLVKANTGGVTWEDGANSITEVSGLLIVTQSKSVHEEVRKLLDQLRQYK